MTFADERLPVEDRIVRALEDPSMGYTADVYIQILDEPSLDYVCRPCWKDGRKTTETVLTSMVPCQFWSNHRGSWDRIGYIRYVQTNALHMIHWKSTAEWREDRWYRLRQDMDIHQSGKIKHVWKMDITSRFPWWKPHPPEDDGSPPPPFLEPSSSTGVDE